MSVLGFMKYAIDLATSSSDVVTSEDFLISFSIFL